MILQMPIKCFRKPAVAVVPGVTMLFIKIVLAIETVLGATFTLCLGRAIFEVYWPPELPPAQPGVTTTAGTRSLDETTIFFSIFGWFTNIYSLIALWIAVTKRTRMAIVLWLNIRSIVTVIGISGFLALLLVSGFYDYRWIIMIIYACFAMIVAIEYRNHLLPPIYSVPETIFIESTPEKPPCTHEPAVKFKFPVPKPEKAPVGLHV